MEEIDLLLPEVIAKYAENLGQKVDVEKMVEKTVR